MHRRLLSLALLALVPAFVAAADLPGRAVAPAVGDPQRVATIDGRPYDYDTDNFDRQPSWASIVETGLPRDALAAVRKFVAEHPTGAAPDENIPAAVRARAEQLLRPRIRSAEAGKAGFDQAVIDIARATGALGQIVPPTLKGMDRTVEKLVLEYDFDVGRIHDLLRATIVVARYGDAQKVVDAIGRRFAVMRVVDRADAGVAGPLVSSKPRSQFFGYGDVLVNVAIDNGTIAEIQINVPEMLAAKEYAHAAFEVLRSPATDEATRAAAAAAMSRLYDAAYSARSGGVERTPIPPRGGSVIRGQATSDLPSSE